MTEAAAARIAELEDQVERQQRALRSAQQWFSACTLLCHVSQHETTIVHSCSAEPECRQNMLGMTWLVTV